MSRGEIFKFVYDPSLSREGNFHAFRRSVIKENIAWRNDPTVKEENEPSELEIQNLFDHLYPDKADI
tara:strand:- start:637 stop:837 length:201 start_codon:yes stop_codon:yes gene_type:complete